MTPACSRAVAYICVLALFAPLGFFSVQLNPIKLKVFREKHLHFYHVRKLMRLVRKNNQNIYEQRSGQINEMQTIKADDVQSNKQLTS